MIAKEIGSEIARARKKKNISIADISEQTRISADYLAELENGNFEFLPRPYVTAYIKTFAAKVGLNGEALVKKWHDAEAQAEAEHADEQVPASANAAEKATQPAATEHIGTPKSSAKRSEESKHLREFGVGASVIAALAFVFYFANQPGDRDARHLPDTAQPASEVTIAKMIAENEARLDSIASNIPEIAPQATTPETPLTLRLEASDTVWIKLVIDGADTSEYLFRPGNARSWQAQDSFILRTGNAGATRLFRNGVPLDSLGRRGEVRQIRISRNDSG